MNSIADRATLTREDRQVTIAPELRADEDGTVSFDGVASVVDEPYVVRDMFGEFEETIVKGAFNRTLTQRDDVRLLVQHEGLPLARTKSKTLSLSANPDLHVSAKLDPANPKVQEIRSAVARGDLDQMSVGMRVRDQEWNPDHTKRIIREVQLFDVSIVAAGSNPLTFAQVRALDETIRTLTDGVEHDPGMVRRAIAHLETLLPTEEVEERDDIHPDLVEAFYAAVRRGMAVQPAA